MSDLISTRRAIEICVARLPMHDQVRNAMAHHLAREIEKASSPPDFDADAMRAKLHLAIYALDGIDHSFPKKAMLQRIQDARQVLEELALAKIAQEG